MPHSSEAIGSQLFWVKTTSTPSDQLTGAFDVELTSNALGSKLAVCKTLVIKKGISSG